MALWKWPRWRASPVASPAERRAATRYPGSRITSSRIIALPSNIPIRAKLRDISSSGLGLLVFGPLTKGTFLVVDLQGAGKFFLRIRAHVVHATPHSEGIWVLGCVLERELRQEELEALL